MPKVRRHPPKPGDHIYTDRRLYLYFHHGIYVGKASVTNTRNEEVEIDDAVIHFMGVGKSKNDFPCGRCGHSSRRIGVVITCLDCFLDGHSLYLYKYGVPDLKFSFKRSGTCSVDSSLPADQVIKTAFDFLKEQNFGKYNFVLNNCEDFAVHCKTGKAISMQVVGHVQTIVVLVRLAYDIGKVITDVRRHQVEQRRDHFQN